MIQGNNGVNVVLHLSVAQRFRGSAGAAVPAAREQLLQISVKRWLEVVRWAVQGRRAVAVNASEGCLCNSMHPPMQFRLAERRWRRLTAPGFTRLAAQRTVRATR